MTGKVSARTETNSLVLAVSGKFMFKLHDEFRDAYAGFTIHGGDVRVNLAATTYMDSSGLGMLILLQEHAKKYQQKVWIESPCVEIRRVLHTSCFDQLFSVV